MQTPASHPKGSSAMGTPSSSEDPDCLLPSAVPWALPSGTTTPLSSSPWCQPSYRSPEQASPPSPGPGPPPQPCPQPHTPSLTVGLVLVLFSPHGSVSRVIGAWETWQLTCHQPRPPVLTSQPHPCLWSPTHSSSSFYTLSWRAGSWKASLVRGSGQGCLLRPHGRWPQGLTRLKKTLQNSANYFNRSTVTPTPSCQRLSVEMRFALTRPCPTVIPSQLSPSPGG